MFNIPEDIEVGHYGEYQTIFETWTDKHPIPEIYPFRIEEIDKKLILIRYLKIYPPSRFNNYEKRDFGILTKRRLKRKNKPLKEGWCFMGIGYNYSHESLVFY